MIEIDKYKTNHCVDCRFMNDCPADNDPSDYRCPYFMGFLGTVYEKNIGLYELWKQEQNNE